MASSLDHSGSRFLLRSLAERGVDPRQVDLLDIGCGDAVELDPLRSAGCRITATDIHLVEGLQDDPGVRFLECPVEHMPFANATFDVAFCYHGVEHTADPAEALAEIRRVLRPGGCLYLGVPNRHRIVGYLESRDARFAEKVRWNISDYRARLGGHFRNERGAHAGFATSELDRLLQLQFSQVDWVTADYLRFKYPRLPAVVLSAPMVRVVAPAVYALAWRGVASPDQGAQQSAGWPTAAHPFANRAASVELRGTCEGGKQLDGPQGNAG